MIVKSFLASIILVLVAGMTSAIPAHSVVPQSDAYLQLGVQPVPGGIKVTWSAGQWMDTTMEASSHPGTATCSAPSWMQECTLTGLTNGATYTVAFFTRSRYTNWDGGSGERLVGPYWSSPVVPCCSVPDPVPALNVALSGNTAVLSWDTPENWAPGSSDLTYRVGSVPATSECVTSENNCTIPDLEEGTGYTFVITPESPGGVGAQTPSEPVFPVGPPGPPTNVQVFLKGKGKGDVSWLAPAKTGGAVVDRYVAVASPGGAVCESPGGLTCTVRGLKNGTNYTFTVTAYNVYGASPASDSSRVARPLAGPGKPKNVKARVVGGSSARVTWKPPASTGGLPVKRYVVRSSPQGSTCTKKRALTCLVRNLRPGTRYVFTVQAFNAKGPGAITQSPAITTPASPSTPSEPEKPNQEIS